MDPNAEDEFYILEEDGTGETFCLPDITSTIPVAYPSTYLESNPGKPTVKIYNFKTNNDAFAYVSRDKETSTWSDMNICTFLVQTITELHDWFSYDYDKEWTSFGRDFKLPSSNRITPLNFLEIEAVDRPENTIIKNPTKGDLKERKNWFFGILMLYRKTIARNSSDDYYSSITQKLHTLFSTGNLQGDPEIFTDLSVYVGDERMTSGYKRIICAIDMFYNRNLQHPYASIRMATLPSKFRGCVALVSMGSVAEKCGMKSRDFAYFIYTQAIVKDLKRISKKSQELDNDFGYFPYHLELGMSTRSAYSLAANPTLCLYLHVIGCMLGSDRSRNAIMPENATDIVSTYNNALMVALGLGISENFKIRVLRNKTFGDEFSLDIRATIARELGYDEVESEPEVEPGHEDYDKQKQEARDRLKKNLDKYKNKIDTEMQRRKEMGPMRRSALILKTYQNNGGFIGNDLEYIATAAMNCKECKPGTVGKNFYSRYARIN